MPDFAEPCAWPESLDALVAAPALPPHSREKVGTTDLHVINVEHKREAR